MMTKMSLTLTVAMMAVAFFGGLVCPANAEDQNVAGTWTGTAIQRAGNREERIAFTMVLAQEGRTVTGRYSRKSEGQGRNGGIEIKDIPVTGTIAGEALALKITDVAWNVTVQGDNFSGSAVRSNGVALNVSATRNR